MVPAYKKQRKFNYLDYIFFNCHLKIIFSAAFPLIAGLTCLPSVRKHPFFSPHSSKLVDLVSYLTWQKLLIMTAADDFLDSQTMYMVSLV